MSNRCSRRGTHAIAASSALLTLLLSPYHAALAGPPSPRAAPSLSVVAGRLIGAAQVESQALETVISLCDGVGHRLAGSAALDRAIAWGADWMRTHGFTRVHTEPVMVPVWIRGTEHLALETPTPRTLQVLALGGSVGTPPGGLHADVIVATSFAHLDALGDAVKGKVVVFDVPFTDYGETVEYRWGAASAAAAKGAVAALVRSVTPSSLYTPHTGAMGYEDGIAKIPAAAITVEDAILIHRMTAAGQAVRVHLELGAHTAPDAPSANVVGDILGREKPDEVVLLGCHLDSWDVGEGAQDDGAGCAIVLEAGRLIGRLDVRPRRSIRVVLFTNEENGLRGGKGYAATHQADAARHVAAIEADTGAGRPDGFRVEVPTPPASPAKPGSPGSPAGNGTPPTPSPERAHPTPAEARILAALAPIAALLAPILAGGLTLAHAGADVGPLIKHGVLGLGLSQDTSGYWPIHHTRADTVDKIDRRALDLNVAAVAVMAYALAELADSPALGSKAAPGRGSPTEMPGRLDLGVTPTPAVVPER